MAVSIPGYQILKLIAEGGMATVYLARQVSLDRAVALKLLRKFDKPTDSQRFLNEARIIASLNHRNIITVHDVGSVGEHHYIATEYLEGGDLRQRLRHPIDTGSALQLLETLGACLAFVHAREVIHRDIKPENILFRSDGTPILTDFGIAKQLHSNKSLTMEGMALGSPHYLSPEQASATKVDARTDLYSLGVVFYEMLTGTQPYTGSSAINVIMAHVTEPKPQLPGSLNHFQPLLDRLMAKDPGHRFSGAGDMVAFAQQIREGLRHTPKPTEQLQAQPTTRRLLHPHRSLLLVGATSLALVSLAIVLPPLNSDANRNEQSESAVETSSATHDADSVESPTVKPNTDLAFVNVEPRASENVAPRRLSSAADNVIPSRHSHQDPPLVGLPHSADQTKIDEYLLLATEAQARYRLTRPPKDNAYYYYQKIIDLDPDSQVAHNGISAVANAYADLAQAAFDRFNYPEARRYVKRGLKIQPNNKRLQALSRRTRIARDVKKRIMKQIDSWF